jgi:hypothetical protein
MSDEDPRSSKLPALVNASAVLAALSEVRRRGHWPLLQELEAIEPDLIGFVLEEISAIYATSLKTGARARRASDCAQIGASGRTSSARRKRNLAVECRSA